MVAKMLLICLQEVTQTYVQVPAPTSYLQEAAYRTTVHSPVAPQMQQVGATYYGSYY